MVKKKLCMKIISSILTAAITVSGLHSMPVIANAAEEADNSAVVTVAEESSTISNITNFTSISDNTVESADNTITLNKNENGDHHAVYDDLEKPTNVSLFFCDSIILQRGVFFPFFSKNSPSKVTLSSFNL